MLSQKSHPLPAPRTKSVDQEGEEGRKCTLEQNNHTEDIGNALDEPDGQVGLVQVPMPQEEPDQRHPEDEGRGEGIRRSHDDAQRPSRGDGIAQNIEDQQDQACQDGQPMKDSCSRTSREKPGQCKGQQQGGKKDA